MLLFSAVVKGLSCVVLIDTGASHSFISSEFANKVNLVGSPPPYSHVQVADGQPLKIHCQHSVPLTLGAFKETVTLLKVNLSKSFDIILGNDWLSQYSATIQYNPVKLSLVQGTRHISVLPVKLKADVQPPPQLSPLLSALQVKRAVRKGCIPFLVNVTPVISSDSATSTAHLPADLAHQALLQPILTTYADVFPPTLPGLPPVRQVDHTIPLIPGATPPNRPMFRLSPKEHQEVVDHIKSLLALGLIEPSSSPFGSPILFVPKKDGTLRMCIDYRALNKVTVKNKYPLPRIDDLLDQLHGSCFFSSLDLQSGYHQIRITEEDVPKTAFKTPLGLFQFKVLPFGLTNAPATFQRAMNDIFRPFIGKFVLVYLDDILIFSKSAEEHAQHLTQVLELLRKHRLYAKLSKCDFFKPEVNYLGHLVTAQGIRPDPKKVQAVSDWPCPTSQSALRSFLGLTNYFRKFIQGYSSLVAPLMELLKHTSLGVWTPLHDQVFLALKHALVSAPVLAMPDFSPSAPPFEVVCDASVSGLGAVLLQSGHPIAYESRKLSSAEYNYATGEQELLAVVHALTVFRCYLEGSSCILVTDHNPNTFFQTKSCLSRRQDRWSQFLERFHYTWQYRPGRVNVADPLSRVFSPCVSCLMVLTRSQRTSSSAIPMSALKSAILAAYKQDPLFKSTTFTAPLRFHDGFWFKGSLLVVPALASVRQACISDMHDPPGRGHLGITKTLHHLQRFFWWPNMLKDVTAFVNTCVTCQRDKPSNHKPSGLMQPVISPALPWHTVSMDFIVALPLTSAGYDAICVFVDKFTKMVHLVPTHTTVTSLQVAHLLNDTILSKHGWPVSLITDRDSKFMSTLFQECLRLHGIQHCPTTAFHPQSDGQTERVNRVLNDMLRHYVNPVQSDWDMFLSTAEFAINNAWHESVQNTPFFLNHGRHPRCPMTSALDLSPSPAAQNFSSAWQSALSKAKLALEAAQQRQKLYYDHRRQDLILHPGQEVLLSTKNIPFKHGKNKFLPKWIGPFRVSHSVGPLAYALELPPTMKIHNVFHVNLLKPYRSDGRCQPPPPVVQLDGSLEFEVETILSHRTVKRGKSNRLSFLVKWLGFGHEHNTWEPESNLVNCPDILQAYWKLVQSAS